MENIRKIIRKIIIESMEIEEMSGFPRVRSIMRGDVPSVNTIGILTAENPNANAISKSENEERMLELKEYVRSKGYGFIKIKGRFNNNNENSLLIPNITKKDTIEFGEKYEQASVIYGEKRFDEDDKAYFHFEYIEEGVTTDERDVSLAGMEIQNREDFYSMVKSRKFVIPFFES
jgi:hypothetical protein